MVTVEDRDTTLLVKGRVRVVEGEATIFGCPLEPSREISSQSYFPVYLVDCRVEVEGEYIAVKGSTIPESWKELDGFERIFLIGETDSGKSSLATWLINSVEGEAGVIDADIGQADIAHPGAMGIGVARNVPFLKHVKMVDGFFTGTISPMGREARCIRGFSKLCRKLDMFNVSARIVDTTGWVKGKKARDYKLAKIEAFSPDLVVFVGMEKDAVEVYSENIDGCEIKLVESFVPKKRDRESRLEIRSSLYKEWFEECDEFEVRGKDLRGTTLFKGEKLEREALEVLSVFGEVVFAEKGSYFLNVCVRGIEISHEAIRAVKEVFGVEEVTVFDESWLNGLMCGIYSNINGMERYVCPGIVKDVDFERGILKVDAKEVPGNFRVEFGEFRLVDGKEEFVRLP